MLLYRELDQIEDDSMLLEYRKRLVDRFGPIPHEGEELLQVVRLRRLGKRLGCEKIILKFGKMQLQLVGNLQSVYYKSKSFESLINFIGSNARRCHLKDLGTRRLMQIDNVTSIEEATSLL